jgi:selenocysteine lyase/cysteine desulfurase
VRVDRFGAFSVARELPDYHFDLFDTAKRFDYATLPFSEVHQLGAALAYLEKVGVSRIEEHTVALAARLQSGLSAQGYRLFTPPGNRSSIVTFYVKPARDLGAALSAEKIEVTTREAQIRVSPALFNTVADVDRFLAVTQRFRA